MPPDYTPPNTSGQKMQPKDAFKDFFQMMTGMNSWVGGRFQKSVKIINAPKGSVRFSTHMSDRLPGISEAGTVDVMGRGLKCLVCGHGMFFKREAQLNTKVATFFKMDWANASGTCYVCEQCGYIHWFLLDK